MTPPTDITEPDPRTADTPPSTPKDGDSTPVTTTPQLIVIDTGDAPLCTNGACS